MQIIGKQPATPFEALLIGILARNLPGSPDAQAARAATLAAAISAQMRQQKLVVFNGADVVKVNMQFTFTKTQLAEAGITKEQHIINCCETFGTFVGKTIREKNLIRGSDGVIEVEGGTAHRVEMFAELLLPGFGEHQRQKTEAMFDRAIQATHPAGRA